MKKRCKNCQEKIKSSYEFCPSCGKRISEKFGMLGKRDAYQNPFSQGSSNLGGFNPRVLGGMLNRTVKMLEKQMQKEMTEVQKNPRTRVKLMINGKKINLEPKGMKKVENKRIPEKLLPINFSRKNLEKFQKLEKKEPKSQVRRLGDKVEYELTIPGVNSVEDISIIQLDKGIEVRALSKNKAYSKMIGINLPLIKYMISKGKLTLKLDATSKS